MAESLASMVKQLREMTGAGPLDCKKALQENDNDLQKAAEWLRERGIAKAQKKLGKKGERSLNEGVIEVYQHFNKRNAVIVEVNCETDFVANTDQFQTFARDVALHISNMKPRYVAREEVPAEVVANERRVLLASDDLQGKPENIQEKIVEGRLEKFYQEIVLMEQEFLKDDSKTINQLLEEAVAEIGEPIVISRFAVYELGENEGNAEDDE
jgi:elongation factor Ts